MANFRGACSTGSSRSATSSVMTGAAKWNACRRLRVTVSAWWRKLIRWWSPSPLTASTCCRRPGWPRDSRDRKTAADQPADALLRLRDAREFLEVGSPVRDTKPKAAITLFVQPGIAASDAICGMTLGEYWRGDSHAGATSLLGDVTPNGRELAKSLRTLLGMKDGAQYSTRTFSASEAVRAERAVLAWIAAGEARSAR